MAVRTVILRSVPYQHGHGVSRLFFASFAFFAAQLCLGASANRATTTKNRRAQCGTCTKWSSSTSKPGSLREQSTLGRGQRRVMAALLHRYAAI